MTVLVTPNAGRARLGGPVRAPDFLIPYNPGLPTLLTEIGVIN